MFLKVNRSKICQTKRHIFLSLLIFIGFDSKKCPQLQHFFRKKLNYPFKFKANVDADVFVLSKQISFAALEVPYWRKGHPKSRTENWKCKVQFFFNLCDKLRFWSLLAGPRAG